jgi:hypothetical protein
MDPKAGLAIVEKSCPYRKSNPGRPTFSQAVIDELLSHQAAITSRNIYKWSGKPRQHATLGGRLATFSFPD